MHPANPKTDWYFAAAEQWQAEIMALRQLLLDCHLAEELKWGCPCYTFEGRNIVLIHTFKQYCALLFFQGALLKDPKHLLVQQTENVQAARQLRFTQVQEVKKQAAAIRAFVLEAAGLSARGVKVPMKQTKDYPVPQEWQSRIDADPVLKTAFEALTPGRQRAYLFHFGQAKQAKTRIARIDKYIPLILSGKGIDDA